NSLSMLFENTKTNRFGGSQHGAIRHRAAGGRRERDERSHVFRPLTCDRTCDDTTKTMTDQMNLAPGFGQRLFDGLVQTALNEKVGAFRVEADAGKIGTVPNPPQPRVKLG